MNPETVLPHCIMLDYLKKLRQKMFFVKKSSVIHCRFIVIGALRLSLKTRVKIWENNPSQYPEKFALTAHTDNGQWKQNVCVLESAAGRKATRGQLNL